MPESNLSGVYDYVMGVVVGLNWLYGCWADLVTIGPLTAAQREAHWVITEAAIDSHARLVSSYDDRDQVGWSIFEDKGAAPRLDLITEAVAVLDCAAMCNPATLIRGFLGASIGDARTIFLDPPGGLDSFPGFSQR